MKETKIYHIVPVAKPRQTQSDRWKKRPCVERYRRFKDQCKLLGVKLPESDFHVVFVIPMPKAWGKRKRAYMNGLPHQKVPDSDNLVKALFDAVLDNDSHIWDFRVTKIWGACGGIIIGSANSAIENFVRLASQL